MFNEIKMYLSPSFFDGISEWLLFNAGFYKRNSLTTFDEFFRYDSLIFTMMRVLNQREIQKSFWER